MIKLIASDIDGTLLEEGTNTLNPEYFEVICRLREHGVLFAAASGRQYSSIRRLFEPVRDKILFIAENGSIVIQKEEVLQQVIMNRVFVEELVRQLRTVPGAELTVSTRDAMYVETKDEEFYDWLLHGYRNDLIRVDDVLEKPLTVNKASLYMRSGVDAVAPALIEEWSDRFKVVVAGAVWVDFMDYRADKGIALSMLQRMLHITPEETMAFGDNGNDIGMFKSAEESYAVGNAREHVKLAAKHLADTNERHGVLQVLKNLLRDLEEM